MDTPESLGFLSATDDLLLRYADSGVPVAEAAVRLGIPVSEARDRLDRLQSRRRQMALESRAASLVHPPAESTRVPHGVALRLASTVGIGALCALAVAVLAMSIGGAESTSPAQQAASPSATETPTPTRTPATTASIGVAAVKDLSIGVPRPFPWSSALVTFRRSGDARTAVIERLVIDSAGRQHRRTLFEPGRDEVLNSAAASSDGEVIAAVLCQGSCVDSPSAPSNILAVSTDGGLTWERHQLSPGVHGIIAPPVGGVVPLGRLSNGSVSHYLWSERGETAPPAARARLVGVDLAAGSFLWVANGVTGLVPVDGRPILLQTGGHLIAAATRLPDRRMMALVPLDIGSAVVLFPTGGIPEAAYRLDDFPVVRLSDGRFIANVPSFRGLPQPALIDFKTGAATPIAELENSSDTVEVLAAHRQVSEVTGDGCAPLRDGPGIASTREVECLAPGTLVRPTTATFGGDEGDWLEVTTSRGHTGWMQAPRLNR